MVYKGRGRERVGMAGGGGVETDRQTEIEDEEGGEDRQTDRQTERDREGELHSKAVVFQPFCR